MNSEVTQKTWRQNIVKIIRICYAGEGLEYNLNTIRNTLQDILNIRN